MTSRGLLEADFDKVFQFVDRGIQIALKLVNKSPSSKSDFNAMLEECDDSELSDLKEEVTAFARSFPTIGFEDST
jgi:glycine hydroxymethyltransferase